MCCALTTLECVFERLAQCAFERFGKATGNRFVDDRRPSNLFAVMGMIAFEHGVANARDRQPNERCPEEAGKQLDDWDVLLKQRIDRDEREYH